MQVWLCEVVPMCSGGPKWKRRPTPSKHLTTASTTEQLPFFRLPASLYPTYSCLLKQVSLMCHFAETLVRSYALLKVAELVSGRAWACPKLLPFHCFAIKESSVVWLARGQARTSRS